MTAIDVRVGGRPLSMRAVERFLQEPRHGALVLFVGRVRPDRAAGGTVRALWYEADRAMAIERLRKIAERAARSAHGGRVAIHHRVGLLPVGTPSVIVGVSAGHRAEAFAAARSAIEALKRAAPIWKTDRVRHRPPRAK